jgi:flavin reductase (DIM6/NTAB) family NADH-FMN oxidoreductase RutF
VVVRPTRYTFGFMQRFDTFTLCAFPERYRRALSLLGSKSGRDGDKIAESGLTPVRSERVAAPCFAEAELVLECRKLYWSDFDPSHFMDASILSLYPARDFHRAYFGEVVEIRGTDAYSE